LLFGAAQVRAGFSPIQPSNNPGEMNIPQVLGQAYGGTFTQAANGVDFTNGTVTATRVDDGADQVFRQPIASAKAVYDPDASAGALTFGYLPGSTGGTFTPLFTETGSMTNVTGSSGALNVGGPYRFAVRRGNNAVASSGNSDNADGLDRLVTYKISGSGLGSNQNWLLGFEDGAHPPFDYNDAVAVQTAGVGAAAVPLPLAAWTGLSGLFGLGAAGVTRRIRRG